MITQKWCGQTQPHDPHTWAYMPRTGSGMALWASCAGHTGAATPTETHDD